MGYKLTTISSEAHHVCLFEMVNTNRAVPPCSEKQSWFNRVSSGTWRGNYGMRPKSSWFYWLEACDMYSTVWTKLCCVRNCVFVQNSVTGYKILNNLAQDQWKGFLKSYTVDFLFFMEKTTPFLTICISSILKLCNWLWIWTCQATRSKQFTAAENLNNLDLVVVWLFKDRSVIPRVIPDPTVFVFFLKFWVAWWLFSVHFDRRVFIVKCVLTTKMENPLWKLCVVLTKGIQLKS